MDDARDRAGRTIGGYGMKLATIGRKHWLEFADTFEADAAGVLPPHNVLHERCQLLSRYVRRLVEARRWVDQSYAYNQNDHAGQVYNRLRSFIADG